MITNSLFSKQPLPCIRKCLALDSWTSTFSCLKVNDIDIIFIDLLAPANFPDNSERVRRMNYIACC